MWDSENHCLPLFFYTWFFSLSLFIGGISLPLVQAQELPLSSMLPWVDFYLPWRKWPLSGISNWLGKHSSVAWWLLLLRICSPLLFVGLSTGDSLDFSRLRKGLYFGYVLSWWMIWCSPMFLWVNLFEIFIHPSPPTPLLRQLSDIIKITISIMLIIHPKQQHLLIQINWTQLPKILNTKVLHLISKPSRRGAFVCLCQQAISHHEKLHWIWPAPLLRSFWPHSMKEHQARQSLLIFMAVSMQVLHLEANWQPEELLQNRLSLLPHLLIFQKAWGMKNQYLPLYAKKILHHSNQSLVFQITCHRVLPSSKYTLWYSPFHCIFVAALGTEACASAAELPDGLDFLCASLCALPSVHLLCIDPGGVWSSWLKWGLPVCVYVCVLQWYFAHIPVLFSF